MVHPLNRIVLEGGISSKEIRDAATGYIKYSKYEKIIIPGCGKFAVVEALVKSGVRPSKIICSDTSLYSTALGYYLSGRDLAELEIESDYDFIDSSARPSEYIAGIILGIKLSLPYQKSYYKEQFRQALIQNPRAQILFIKKAVEKLRDQLGGITYRWMDFRDEVDLWKDNGKALLYLAPHKPNKLELAPHITWKKPDNNGNFGSEGTTTVLIDHLLDAQAQVMIELAGGAVKESPKLPQGWTVLMLRIDSNLKSNSLILNHQETCNISRPKLNQVKGLPYPIITDKDIITENSTVKALIVDLNVANYYRDLFTHKLGAGLAGINVVILIDGKIVSIRGYTSAAQCNPGEMSEFYGVVHNNTRYKHLGRLIMRLIITKQYVETINNMILFDVQEITTTKLSPYRESREAKGILEEYACEPQKNGTYITRYRGQVRDRSYSACIREWLIEEKRYEGTQINKGKGIRKLKMRSVGGVRPAAPPATAPAA